MKQSAGLLVYRIRGQVVEVLLVHPGGPFWSKKDLGAWSVPKGELDSELDALSVACREFEEELGVRPPVGEAQKLEPVKQSGGKQVQAWAVEGDLDVSSFKSNTFSLEWPPKSGKQQKFPEVDMAEWFDLASAYQKILKSQAPLLRQLEKKLNADIS